MAADTIVDVFGFIQPYKNDVMMNHSQVTELLKKSWKSAMDVKRKTFYQIMEKCTKLCMEE